MRQQNSFENCIKLSDKKERVLNSAAKVFFCLLTHFFISFITSSPMGIVRAYGWGLPHSVAGDMYCF